MYNDFVLVGPPGDPAHARGADIVLALQRIASHNAEFISRGDKSGTHAAELRYWKLLAEGADKGRGYKECGCGMGPALNMAASLGAYVLTDRGTWLSFMNRNDLTLLVEGDKRMFNQYGVMVLNPARYAHVKQVPAQQFVDWLTTAPGQAVIASYRINGQQLFFPNARR
jgi:tungstate transport system substrate-binding protein